MSTPRVTVFTEQRCWDGGEHHSVRGRKELSALGGLADAVPCVVAYRATSPGDGAEELLPGSQAGAELLPEGSANHALQVRNTVRAVAGSDGCVVYQPGIVGGLAGLIALGMRKPLAVVAVGDPQTSLSPDVLPGASGRAVQAVMVRVMRLLCRRAFAVRYVTQSALQSRYPVGARGAAFAASDVGNVPMVADSTPRSKGHTTQLLTVASLDQPYKGVEELIDACAELRSRGEDVHLSVAGTGRLKAALEQHAAARLPGGVTFLGHLTGDELRNAYTAADIFVLASWTEGLPRVVVEAMAAARPVVATAVGGVPELVEQEWLVPARDSRVLADALGRAIAAAPHWAQWGRSNQQRATAFVQQSIQEHHRFISFVEGRLTHGK